MTSDFQCKLADIGSGSRFRESKLMKTNRVGTRGFQAPELLCGKNYSKKCDTFSLGVTLFVLMSKTMPCREEATVQDPLYVYMAAKKYEDYWGKFARGGIVFGSELKELLQGMLAYQPVERMNVNDFTKDGKTLEGIKSTAWYKGEVFQPSELKQVLTDRFKVARNKRNKVRNPETEIHSISFRSGTATVLPKLPPSREGWAVAVDPTAQVANAEGEMIKLHPDHIIHTLMNHYEVEEKRCTTVYDEAEGHLELKGQDGDFTYQINIDAYEKDGDYFMDIRPVANWHHPACKKLTDDVYKYLNVM
jgi:serine/threonine protein kinase